jgi:hypothetical protein
MALPMGGVIGASRDGASREIGGGKGDHTGRGAGRREKYTLAASYGPPYQQPHSSIKKAPSDLSPATETVYRCRAAIKDTDCSSCAFLVHLQTP